MTREQQYQDAITRQTWGGWTDTQTYAHRFLKGFPDVAERIQQAFANQDVEMLKALHYVMTGGETNIYSFKDLWQMALDTYEDEPA